MSKSIFVLLFSALTIWITGGNEGDFIEDTYVDQPWEEARQTWGHPQIVEADTPVAGNPNNRVGDVTRQRYRSPLQLGMPRNYAEIITLDTAEFGYSIFERIGKVDIRRPSHISFEDYLRFRRESQVEDYFRQKALNANRPDQRGLEFNIDAGELTDVFGGGPISVRPTGLATLNFSIDNNKTNNPNLPIRQQSTTIFNFDQQIQLGVIGQIGKKLKLNANFDTQATFDFENELKLEHTGTEDQILQKIEAGNVSMRLGNSLIQGRQNLFGVKTRLRFGPVYLTAIASTERGQVQSVNVSGGGAIETPFEKDASDYDMNRHFFLSQYFRSRYEDALKDLPIIRSQARINRVEIWVEQQGATSNTRNAVGFVDLGENNIPAADGGQGVIYNPSINGNPSIAFSDNEANDLYSQLQNASNAREQATAKGAVESLGLGMVNTEDFQVLGNMRRLNPNEYTINTQLGYVSLNSPIPTDQVLFVAFDYTANGQTFQVGEFSDDVPANGLNSNVLFLKMLKSSVLRVNTGNRPYPAWDLMMKNIYSIGYGLSQDGFFLDVKYESGTSAGKINYLPTGAVANRPLLQVVGLDRLTNHTAPGADNYFDFIEGITVRSDRGLIIFPVLEPFGENLTRRLQNDLNETSKYVFQPLYDDTKAAAEQDYPQLDRYSLEGFYRSSSSSEIPLNTFNLAEGSVTVTAGGRQLTEGSDFQVDYFGGKVTIINPAILSSGQDIQVSYESSSLYQVQTKTLLGARAEYAPNDKIQLGLTALNLREQPFNQKLTLGDEPVNNTLWGVDASYQDQSPLLTKLIDRVPLISTKAQSNIQAALEFAQFVPGVPGVIKNDRDRGIVYLDDFEAAATPYTLQGVQHWQLASYPDYNPALYDPRTPADSLSGNYTRAKLAWYRIDQTFYQRGNINIPQSDLSSNYTRQVQPWELFPTASRAFGNNIQFTFDLHYLPTKRGPYNFVTAQNRIDPSTGNLLFPDQNWAGIMREIDINNDFEATNVEFVEFWMMDPFMDNPAHQGGEFYINLGLISEDVLPDEALSRENGLPGAGDPGNLRPTAYGQIPIGNPPVNAFSNDPDDRAAQDIGLDGLSSDDESTFFQANFLGALQGFLSPQAFQELADDPSSDDFVHFRGDEYEDAGTDVSILDRYLQFNGLEGNSPVNQSQDQNQNFTTQATQQPNTEDLNGNGSVNFAEQYWEYRINLRPGDMVPGQNYIVDRVDTLVTANNQQIPVTWYQFRIPLNTGRAVNNIPNFKSINFMRMYMTGFSEEVIMRMTEFQFLSTQWRRYSGDLSSPDVIVSPPQPPFASFELGSLTIEQNSTKLPFNYVLPPGIERQALNGNTAVGFLQDERSLTMKVCGLEDGDARAMFRNVKHDLRQYDRLRLFVHAEPIDDGVSPSNFEETGDATVFMRLGLDNDFNYYEYEIPLTPSTPGRVADPFNVWLDSNEFDFELLLLALAKEDRNSAGTGLIYRHAYQDSTMPVGHTIYVKGTPKLSDIRNIMIGVRNPVDGNEEKICLEVWVNELRLTNFDRKNGYAANFNTSMTLADLGTLNASGAFKTAGFGPLDQKLSDRPQEDSYRYDVSTNLNLDKFFPKDWGLSLPVYATYGEQLVNPKFDPQEADVSTERLLENLDPEDAKTQRQEIQDYRRSRSISFNNWRINPGGGTGSGPGGGRAAGGRAPGRQSGRGRSGGKAGSDGTGGGGKLPMPWNPSNFDFTYAYNEQFSRNAITARRFNTTHRGGINYRYNLPQIQLQPFKGLDKVPMLQQISFSPLPQSFTASITGNRQFEERALRPTNEFGGAVDPLFTKNFMINRSYNLSWNVMRSLQITFNANNVSRVDEVKGYWEDATEFERDSVGRLIDNLIYFGRNEVLGKENLLNIGRTTNYQHNFNVVYQLPFSQIKPLNWISGNVNYSGGYQWAQAPEVSPGFGGTASNNQSIQASGRLDLNSLYRKVKFFREVLDGQNKAQQRRPTGRPVPRPGEELSRPPEEPTAQDSAKGPDPFKFLKIVGKELVRIGLSVRSVDVNYNSTNSMILPGYLPKTDNFGIDWNYVDTMRFQRSAVFAPTAGFVFGSQQDIRQLAAENRWITQDPTLASAFSQMSNEQLTARTSVEIFKGFRIDLNATRSLNQNNSEFFRWDPIEEEYGSFDRLLSGSFTMSYIFINTAFEPNEENSEVFNTFSANRIEISRRLSQSQAFTDSLSYVGIVEGGFQNGYVGTTPQVLVPSLLSAYGVIGSDQVSLSPFPKIPLPNWSVNYNLVNGLPFLKGKFTALTLKHTYRGTYSVGNFTNNLLFDDINGDGVADIPKYIGEDIAGNSVESYIPLENIQAVQISEQFAPLIGVNATLKNGATAQIDYKRGRQLTFNLGNLQMTEMRSQDLAIMMGYRKDKVNITFDFGGRTISLQNSMNFNLRVTLRDTRERLRTLGPTGTPNDPVLSADYTRGTLNFILSPSIDYTVNRRLNVTVFFERNVNSPYVSNAYRTSFTSGGVKLRFTLSG